MNFIVLDVDQATEEQAKKIRAERDEKYGNIFMEAPSDMRWVGEIGEIVFKRWANSFPGISARWITDKVAGQPDFEINGFTVDVKTVKRKDAVKPHYTAQVTARHAKHRVDFYFFASYELPRRRLWLLGGISQENFIERARYHGPGDKVHANYTVRPGHEIYNIAISKLEPPQYWLEALALD